MSQKTTLSAAELAHEEAIERARQTLLSAGTTQERSVAANHFRQLCLLRDPHLIARLESARMIRAAR